MYVHTFAYPMGIEEDIKQPKFQTEHEKLLVNLMYTGAWIKNYHSGLLKDRNRQR